MKHSLLRPLLFAVMILFVAEDVCFLLNAGPSAGLHDELEAEEYKGNQEPEKEGKQEKEEKSKEESKEKDKDRHPANLRLTSEYTRSTRNTLHDAVFHPASAVIDLETPPPEARP